MNPLRELEQNVLAEGREWTRRKLEESLQGQCEATEPLCPKTGARLKDPRWRDFQFKTVAGIVKLRAYYGYSVAMKKWLCPVREIWKLKPHQRLSPELASRLTYTATETASYETAARMAANWGSPVSDGCIHQLVQQLGEAAEELDLPTPEPPGTEPEFSLVIMLDGWMARERGPDWGAPANKEDLQRIAWREIKSAVIYRLEQRAENAARRGMLIEKFAVATAPETTPVDFGTAVHAEALRRGLGRAKTVYLVMDGAVWLWELAEDRFGHAVKTLDFHHARDHLWALAHALHGEDTKAAREWVQPLLRSLRGGQEKRVVRQIEQLLEGETQYEREAHKTIEREINYFRNHRDHLHYQTMEKAGAPRGSGAIESLGKHFQRRLRGCGQIWGRKGVTHLLQLCVLVKNRDDSFLWN